MSGRAVGVRRAWAEMPTLVHDWVAGRLGSPVVAALDQTGGFSPGCATRERCADGTRAFGKAVSSTLNAHTPVLFRREIAALTALGTHPLWASLLGSYDDGEWVVLLLEDVEGARPDLDDDVTMHRLLRSTDELVAELARRVPAPSSTRSRRSEDGSALYAAGPVDLDDVFAGWLTSFDAAPATAGGVVPAWVLTHHADLRHLVVRLTTEPCTHAVHYDIRDDNLVQRPDGSIVFVDWGAFGVGPAWTDPLLARLERVDRPWFDASLTSSAALAAAGDDLVTAFLLALGTHLAVRSTTPPPPGLPTMNAFRRAEADRFLSATARRLDLGP